MACRVVLMVCSVVSPLPLLPQSAIAALRCSLASWVVLLAIASNFVLKLRFVLLTERLFQHTSGLMGFPEGHTDTCRCTSTCLRECGSKRTPAVALVKFPPPLPHVLTFSLVLDLNNNASHVKLLELHTEGRDREHTLVRDEWHVGATRPWMRVQKEIERRRQRKLQQKTSARVSSCAFMVHWR